MKRIPRAVYAAVSVFLVLLMIGILTGLPAISPGMPGAPGGPYAGTMLGIAYAQDAWSGGRFDGPVTFVLPTTQATSTPGITIDGYGLGKILSVQDSATPVFDINNAGVVNAKVLSYATKGGMASIGSSAAGSSSVTVASGLTTLTACFCSLGNDFAADGGFCSAAVSSTNCVLKAWKINATPTAASASQTVYWLAIGVQ